MKKFLFATLMGVLVALVGCQQDDELTGVENTLGKKVSVTANIKANAQSRVAMEYDDAAKIIKVDWKESGEEFIMYDYNDRTKYSFFTQTSGNQFEGELPSGSSGPYYASIGASLNLKNQDGTLNEKCVHMATGEIIDPTQPIVFEHKTTVLKPDFTIGGVTVNSSITQIVMDGVPSIGTITIKPSAIADMFIFLPASSGKIEEGTTFNFTVTADGKDYVAELSISQSMNAGEFYTAAIELEEIPYVTFTADAAQTFKYTGDNLQYSLDGTTFQALEANAEINFGGETKLYLRGVNNPDGTVYNNGNLQTYYKISFGKDLVLVACTGDIRTLIDYKTFKTVDTSAAQFIVLFSGCTELKSAPELPAETLANRCYENMFVGCTSLTEAPALPATTLADNCYKGMFVNCTSLTVAPELSATTLAKGCYYEMFLNCILLDNITMLATDISADDCLKDWVKGVSAIGTFTKASSMTTLPENSTSGIPTGWSVNL